MKTWFVTGASRGLGAVLVQSILDRGDRVVATARRPELLDEKFGPHRHLATLPLDVTDKHQAGETFAAAAARFGEIDVLVNNAGYGLVGAVEEVSDAEARAVLDTNVFGLLNVTRAALPYFRKQGRGQIINIGSMSGISAISGLGIYSATKFAVAGLTEALSKELRPFGIAVTVVEPGELRTDFLAQNAIAFAANAIDAYLDGPVANVRAFHTSAHGQQRGDPKKVAELILRLSDVDKPPLNLPTGADAVAALERQLTRKAEALKPWRELAAATAYDELVGSSAAEQI